MVGTYNVWLVVVSVVVAVVASFVALDLASQVTAARGRMAAWFWMIGGAIAIGAGIWSMHFIGMLAFELPTRVSYDMTLTGVSLLLPIVVSGVGLGEAARQALSRPRLLLGGVFVGLGIVAMHYTGMAAMKMEPPIRYQPSLVGLSILIGVAGSMLSIWSGFRLRMETLLSALVKKAGSALVTGAAISGMHYAAMAAADFPPDSVCTVNGQDINTFGLAATVAGFSLSFQMMTLMISAFHAYRAERTSKQAASLQRENIELDRARLELEARVAERTAELDRTNKKLLEVQESERRRLSRELHDRVGQNLTALAINLDILRTEGSNEDRADLRARLEDSIALVEATADSIEDVLAELRPPMLNDHGLLPALQWYAKEFSERIGIDVVVRGEEPTQRPSQEIEITLFRIAQEALNNVAKHARAGRAELELHPTRTEYILSVSDNGVGFDPQAMPRFGHGMNMMRERAQAIGARFEVHATPSSGTRIAVRVPVQT